MSSLVLRFLLVDRQIGGVHTDNWLAPRRQNQLGVVDVLPATSEAAFGEECTVVVQVVTLPSFSLIPPPRSFHTPAKRLGVKSYGGDDHHTTKKSNQEEAERTKATTKRRSATTTAASIAGVSIKYE